MSEQQKMQHAPSPWTLCYDGQIDATDGSTVCRFRWDSYKEFCEGNNAATARLIAAAPDLLAALQGLRESFHDYVGPNIEAADAAIAKAT